jgi:hypothetical protein
MTCHFSQKKVNDISELSLSAGGKAFHPRSLPFIPAHYDNFLDIFTKFNSNLPT